MFDLFFLGIQEIMHFNLLIFMFIGVTAGIIAGAIPGFTITMAIIITLPFTFGMTPIAGISTMVGVFIGGLSGGLMTAILLGIPGTPSAVATTFDGFPMSQRGESNLALSIGIWASFFGSLISMVILMTLAPQVAMLALKIGPWEYTSLIIFALTIIASITGDSVIKGLIAGFFGLFIGTIGVDPISGFSRFTFGSNMLSAGVPFLTVLIGIFAVSQLLTELETKKETEIENGLTKKMIIEKDLGFEAKRALNIVIKQPVNLIRSSLLGALIGAIPGAGSSISNILAYDQAKKNSKDPKKFGTGIPEGIVASEAGNNATAGGSLIPMIALGIPGDAVTAVMLGALMVHGINPGPFLIIEHPNIVGAIFVGFFIATVMMLVIQFVGIKLITKIISIQKYILVPSILSFCVIGSYILHNRVTDLFILFVMGVIGYFLKKNHFSLAPIILGVILGPIAETNLRRAMMISYDWSLFVTRPISLILLLLAVVSIIYSYRQNRQNKISKKTS